MVQNKAFIYAAVPHGWPVAGKDLTISSSEFDVDQDPPANGFTTKNFYASYDPSQRGRMRDPSVGSYNRPMTPGQPVESVSVIGRVLKSANAKFPVGELVMVPGATAEYGVVSELMAYSPITSLIKEKKGVPLSAWLGALGMTGMTAYGSLMEIGQPKKGQIILVSAAAGAVGQMVGQFALREGLTVIGSVGDDKKLEFITKELGFTAGFNYKKEPAADAIKRLAPDGLDIFYDNVGGEQLDVAIANMKDWGRIVACGSVSQYNNKPEEAYGLKNYPMVVRKRLRWQGFIVFDPDISKHRQERDEKVAAWIADGSLKTLDHVTEGMDHAVEGFLGMLRGDNLGKSVLKIAEVD